MFKDVFPKRTEVSNSVESREIPNDEKETNPPKDSPVEVIFLYS